MSYRKFLLHVGKEDVQIILNNGRTFTGLFHSFDHHMNAIFLDCFEIKKKKIPNSRKISILKRKIPGVVLFRGDTIISIHPPNSNPNNNISAKNENISQSFQSSQPSHPSQPLQISESSISNSLKSSSAFGDDINLGETLPQTSPLVLQSEQKNRDLIRELQPSTILNVPPSVGRGTPIGRGTPNLNPIGRGLHTSTNISTHGSELGSISQQLLPQGLSQSENTTLNPSHPSSSIGRGAPLIQMTPPSLGRGIPTGRGGPIGRGRPI